MLTNFLSKVSIKIVNQYKIIMTDSERLSGIFGNNKINYKK
jgi:hypothetical protein